MRVLIVSNTYPPADISGVGTLVAELARQLDGSGHEVRVLTRNAPASDPWARAVPGPKLFFPFVAALSFLRASGPWDVVHVHESDGALVAVAHRLLRLLGRPGGRASLVATLQVSYRRERLAVRPVRADGRVVSRPAASERVFAAFRAPLLALLGRTTARLADAVVAPSRATAAELEEDYGATVEAVIPNGIRIGAPTPAPAERESPGFTVLFAGRLRTRKGVAVLLEAFARVIEELPGSRLLIAGGGEQHRQLVAHCHRLGLDDAVHFLGLVARDRLRELYLETDVFCLPSTYEGFPLAILEAMTAGLPTVATRVAGVPEAVEDGVTGMTVEAESASALADALLALGYDPERRRELAARARLEVQRSFSIEHVASAYLALWERLAG